MNVPALKPQETPEAPGVHARRLWSFRPKSDRQAGDAIVANFILHWFPSKIYKPSLDWTYSFWLGTISAVLFAILCVTGVVLMFLYVPSVERAYGTVKDINYVVSFGPLVRGLHRVAAHGMVLVVFLHMVRVFLTGGYKAGKAADSRRPWNWVLGVVLLLVTLFFSFTGYLLPWDQLAFWAVTVGTNIARAAPYVGDQISFALLGGHNIDQSALLRFYVLHVAVLPLVSALLLGYHMWRVRKDGGLAAVDRERLTAKRVTADAASTKTWTLLGVAAGNTVHVTSLVPGDERDHVPSVPHLTRRILVVTLVTLLAVTALALVVASPLEAPANPRITPNPAKAPWYFLWLQELVSDTTFRIGSFIVNGALLGGMVIPGVLVLVLALWPWLDRSPVSTIGLWMPRGRRLQCTVFLVICLAIVALTIVGLFLRGPYWQIYWPGQSWPETPLAM